MGLEETSESERKLTEKFKGPRTVLRLSNIKRVRKEEGLIKESVSKFIG
jgi:hypothetical protein